MTTNPSDLLGQAALARADGDRVRARELTDQAITLDLEQAAADVAAAQAALERALFLRRTAMEDARDRGWTYTRIAGPIGLSQQRVNQMLGGTS